MRKFSEVTEGRKKQQGIFLQKFITYHKPWMEELVAKYKERGQFPLFPTFIANYYEDEDDKALAVIATLCLNWRKDILKQVKAFAALMGEHPYQWFTSRGFIVLSTGKNQEKTLCGDAVGVKYWRIAKFFSKLYDLCNGRSLAKTFPVGKGCWQRTTMLNFARSLEEELHFNDCEYKAEVVELVLRASDGFSIGLWPTNPALLRCPVTAKMRKFMKIWFPDYNWIAWKWSEAISLFGLERDYDFFYYYLAWEELKKANAEGCVVYSTRYVSRFKGGYLMGPVFWTGKRGVMPEIKFKDE